MDNEKILKGELAIAVNKIDGLSEMLVRKDEKIRSLKNFLSRASLALHLEESTRNNFITLIKEIDKKLLE
jgi:hypothetical protein